MGPQTGPRLMNLFGRHQLAHDERVTVANLLDELIARKGDCQVSVGDDGVYYRLPSSTTM